MKIHKYRPPLLERHPWIKPACWIAFVVLLFLPQTTNLVMCTLLFTLFGSLILSAVLFVFGPDAMTFTAVLLLLAWGHCMVGFILEIFHAT